MQRYIILLAAFVLCIQTKPAPFYNYAYTVAITETMINKQGTFVTKGQLFYDPINNHERKDV